MSINEGLWSAKLPNGDVRSGTLGQLNEAFRAGHIGEATLVCAAGSANWIRLIDVLGGAAAFSTGTPISDAPPPTQPAPPVAAPVVQPVMASVATPGNGSSDLWQVKLGSGEVRSGTRQQLEDALRAGHLDSNALVLAPGAAEWSKVGTLLRRSQAPAPTAIPSAYPTAAPIAPQPPSAPPATAAAPPSQAPNGSGELWQVRLDNGQVRSGTRKQLEEAFNAGHLADGAFVLPGGSSEWVRLGDLMDRRPVTSVAPPPMPPVAAEPAPAVAGESAPAMAAPEPAVPPQAAPGVPGETAPLVAAEPAPVADEPVSDGLSESASQEADAWDLPTGDRANLEAKEAEQLWQVSLTLKQIQDGFHAGLFDDDTQVLPTGAEEWIPLANVRRTLPPPFGSALAGPLNNDPMATANTASGMAFGAAPQEPASRTEPWPTTIGANRPSPPGE